MTAERRQAPGVPGRRGYLVRNRWLLLALRSVDALPWPARRKTERGPPRRLLLSSFGHLGDCVIATATLNLAKDLLPDTEIGILVGSWAAQMFRDDPRVARVHVIDHWRLDRSRRGLPAKLIRYWRSRRQAVREMRAVGYDAAIDLFYFFPPASPIFWSARIPKRIGYESAGFRRFLTHPHEWHLRKQHVAVYQAKLLGDLGVAPERVQAGLDELRMSLAGVDSVPERGDYVVVHMGTGGATREWSENRWLEVIAGLAERGIKVVLTGRGAAEAARCKRVADAVPGVSNLCDALDWRSLLATIAGARLVIGVNSLSGHVAAAYGVPTITLWAGVVDPAQWHPLGNDATVLHSAPPCLPCYDWRGCDAMSCIRDVRPADVLSAASAKLGIS